MSVYYVISLNRKLLNLFFASFLRHMFSISNSPTTHRAIMSDILIFSIANSTRLIVNYSLNDLEATYQDMDVVDINTLIRRMQQFVSAWKLRTNLIIS